MQEQQDLLLTMMDFIKRNESEKRPTFWTSDYPNPKKKFLKEEIAIHEAKADEELLESLTEYIGDSHISSVLNVSLNHAAICIGQEAYLYNLNNVDFLELSNGLMLSSEYFIKKFSGIRFLFTGGVFVCAALGAVMQIGNCPIRLLAHIVPSSINSESAIEKKCNLILLCKKLWLTIEALCKPHHIEIKREHQLHFCLFGTTPSSFSSFKQSEIGCDFSDFANLSMDSEPKVQNEDDSADIEEAFLNVLLTDSNEFIVDTGEEILKYPASRGCSESPCFQRSH